MRYVRLVSAMTKHEGGRFFGSRKRLGSNESALHADVASELRVIGKRTHLGELNDEPAEDGRVALGKNC